MTTSHSDRTRHRFGFAGTNAFAARVLDGLLDDGIEISLVMSQPDRQAGRRRRFAAPPVAELARERGLPLLQGADAAGASESIRAAGLAAMAICGYGNLIPAALLDELPWLNLHPSILPRWRGAAPVERALLAGDRESGVAVMALVEELDAGPVVVQRRFAIEAGDDRRDVEQRALEFGVPDLAEALRASARGTLVSRPQASAGVSYAQKLTRADRALDPAESVELTIGRIRAFAGSNSAAIDLGGETIGVGRARPADGVLAIGDVEARPDALAIGVSGGSVEALELQAPGKRSLDAASFLRGYRRSLAPARRPDW